MIGKTISHYKILTKLGEGGMGVVYKAEDTRLKRIVALKFLSAIALGGEEKNRFLREAQAAAALNHPNICTIHAIDEADGQMFIAMEFIEGQSLREKINAGPLKIDEAIKFAMQIADGLQAAHEKGITHRDIKSANIMITAKGQAEKGQVKIMDFGLAKLARGGTMLTTEGMTLGTAAYMSPEQARGEAVDHRTDIWSLGVVLYEMISGRLPFRGEYESAMMYSILNEEPEPLTSLRSNVPMDLERVVAKMLAKNPAARYQHVDELPVDLKTIDLSATGASRISMAKVTRQTEKQTAFWLRAIPWSIIIIAVGAAIALWSPWRVSPPRALARFVINLPAEFRLAEVPSVAIAPDGRQVIYAATDSGGGTKLFRRPIDQLEATPITGTEDAGHPFFSPDGQWVGFFAGGKLKKVSLTGGPPLTLCEAQSGYGASWGADETIIFSPTFTSGLLMVSAAGGTPQVVTNIKSEQGELSHRWPQILPDGKAVLFTIDTGMDADDKRIAILSLTTGDRRVVIDQGTNACYAPPGHLIYLRAGSLLAAPFDVERLEVTGPVVTVFEGLRFSGAGVGEYSFSREGSLVWVPAPGLIPTASVFSSTVSFRKLAESTLFWVDRRGATQPLWAPSGGYWTPSLSPDGRRLALTMDLDIFILELDRGALTRFTFEGKNHIPVWTPDGQRLTFASASKAQRQPNLFWKMTDGSSVVEQLLTSKQHQDPGSWSPDGKVLAYAELHTETNWDIWLLRLEGKRWSEPFLQTRFDEYHPNISPDGRWLAYSSNESGRLEVYVQPFPHGRGKWLISTEGGREPLWARNGRELFYRSGKKVMAVAIITEPAFVAERPRLLFEGFYLDADDSLGFTAFGRPNYDVSPDGRFLMIKPEPRPSSTQINLVLNWFEELKRLVPAKNRLQR
jgi:serine/threonine-protein kinase